MLIDCARLAQYLLRIVFVFIYRVLEWKEPEQLRRLIEFDVTEEPASQDRLLELMEDVIKYSVKTGHPRFVNQLFSR